MAKSKRKPAAAVKRPQVPLHAPVPSHTNQGGSLVLGIKSALGKLDGSISHIPRADLPPFPVVNQPSSTGTSTAKETDGSSVDHSNASLDGFLEDDRSEDKNLKKNNLISLVLRKNMQCLPHHLLSFGHSRTTIFSYSGCSRITN
ncbi:hypothetical protein NC652_016756 [Populus alba x Populus x berolinensis]|nr:hypothetical protein NC652_016756 [Populus alba x Populus x berolinensis]